MGGVPIEDIHVVIGHPWGNLKMRLTRWILDGPGLRPLVAPIAAFHAVTGEALPLTVIPLEYRNNRESRRLIVQGIVRNPWPQWGPVQPETEAERRFNDEVEQIHRAAGVSDEIPAPIAGSIIWYDPVDDDGAPLGDPSRPKRL